MFALQRTFTIYWTVYPEDWHDSPSYTPLLAPRPRESSCYACWKYRSDFRLAKVVSLVDDGVASGCLGIDIKRHYRADMPADVPQVS